MHIVCNSHSLFDAQLVSNLTDCSLNVSLIPDNDFAAIITFYGADFKSVIDMATDNSGISDILIRMKFLNTFNTNARYFPLQILKKLYKEDSRNFHTELEDFFFMIYNSKLALIEEEIENMIDSKYGIEPLVDFLNIVKEKFSKFANKSTLSSIDHQFEMLENEIKVNNCISIKGDELKNLLVDVGSYVNKHSPYIMEQHLIKGEDKYNKFLCFLNKLNAFDLNIDVSNVGQKSELSQLITSMNELFVLTD